MISGGDLNNPRRAHTLVAVRTVLHLVSATSIVLLDCPELKCVSCVLQHPHQSANSDKQTCLHERDVVPRSPTYQVQAELAI